MTAPRPDLQLGGWQQQHRPRGSDAILISVAFDAEGEAENISLSQFRTSLRRQNDQGGQYSVGEYAQVLVEEACPDEWLSRIVNRARRSGEGSVRIHYGNGVQTTIQIANAMDSNTVHVAVRLMVRDEIDGSVYQLMPNDSMWDHMNALDTARVARVLITTGGPLWTSGAGQERTIRVWPSADNPFQLERIEVVNNGRGGTEGVAKVQPIDEQEEEPSAVIADKGKKSTSKAGDDKPPAKKNKPTNKAALDDASRRRKDSGLGEQENNSTTKENPKKRRKKTRDLKLPKKASSAYLFFAQEYGAKLREENKAIPFVEVGKLTGLAYKKLTGDEIKKYEDMASQDKERYNSEKEEYDRSKSQEDSKPDSSDDDGTKLPAKKTQYQARKKTEECYSSDEDEQEKGKPEKRHRKKKDPHAPKQSKSAYLIYSIENRPRIQKDNPNASFGEVARLVSAEFKALGDEKSEKYTAMATKDKERYKSEKAEYEKRKAEEDGGGYDNEYKPPAKQMHSKAAKKTKHDSSTGDDPETPGATKGKADDKDNKRSAEKAERKGEKKSKGVKPKQASNDDSIGDDENKHGVEQGDGEEDGDKKRKKKRSKK